MIEDLCCTFTYPNMVKFEQNLDYSNKFMRDAKAIKVRAYEMNLKGL